MFRPQYVGHLQVVHEELINKLYKHMWGVYRSVFGKVRDLVSERGKTTWTGDYDFSVHIFLFCVDVEVCIIIFLISRILKFGLHFAFKTVFVVLAM
jgi:hypothetical protein